MIDRTNDDRWHPISDMSLPAVPAMLHASEPLPDLVRQTDSAVDRWSLRDRLLALPVDEEGNGMSEPTANLLACWIADGSIPDGRRPNERTELALRDLLGAEVSRLGGLIARTVYDDLRQRPLPTTRSAT